MRWRDIRVVLGNDAIKIQPDEDWPWSIHRTHHAALNNSCFAIRGEVDPALPVEGRIHRTSPWPIHKTCDVGDSWVPSPAIDIVDVHSNMITKAQCLVRNLWQHHELPICTEIAKRSCAK